MGQPAGGYVLGSEAEINAKRQAGMAAAAAQAGRSGSDAGAKVVGAGYAEAQKQQEERAQGDKPLTAEQIEDIKKKSEDAAKKKIEDDKRKAEEDAMAARLRDNYKKFIDVKSENNKKCFEKFGNNFFILEDGVNCCNGVMLELPAFSMSTKWDESPAASMAEALLKYVNKPEFEFLATKDNQNYKVLRRSGNLTSKTYESTEPISFEIKFRCYTGQYLGNTIVSSISDWKKLLDKAVIKDLDTNHIVDDVIGNLGAVGTASLNQSFDIIGDIKSALNSKAKEDKVAYKTWSVSDFVLKDVKEYTYDKRYTYVHRGDKSIQINISHSMNNGVPGMIYTGDNRRSRLPHKTTFENWNKKDDKDISVEKILEYFVNFHNEKIEANVAMEKKLATDQLEKINNQLKVNKKRVFNSDDKFGAQLFRLTIYPFIFKEPLIIYISSWTITPSKEWHDSFSTYYYYDVTLSCSMDQIPSSLTWKSMLN